MLRIADPVEWGLAIQSPADGTQPATGTWGTQLTPGNNVYGAYAEVVGNTSDDTYSIRIQFSSNDVVAAARDTIVTLGFDFAGGTTYADMTIDHLLASCAGPTQLAFVGVSYSFDLYVPAGTAIAAKASVNNATVGTLYCAITLLGRPSRPVWAGRYVRTYGAVTATSRGTLVVPGTAAEGAWTQLGTIAAGDTIKAWEFGYGVNDADMGSRHVRCDIGVGDVTNKKVVAPNGMVCTTTVERLCKLAHPCFARGNAGDLVYGRMQTSGAVDTDESLIAYGIGG